MEIGGCCSLAQPLLFFCLAIAAAAHLAFSQEAGSPDYYANSCPNAQSIVRNAVRGSFTRDTTSPAAMIRLLFHDCQVNGCDASILLDSGSDGTSELEAPKNLGIRRLDIIDVVKNQLEAACPQTVSCADIIALAAREAVLRDGGPLITIPLGRQDGLDASESAAQSDLPAATIDVPDLLNLFSNMGMSTEESVAILGSHTVGVAHCTNFVNRLYPRKDPGLSLVYANNLRARCPPRFPTNAFATLDTTDFLFDNSYFRNLISGRALLTVDANLAAHPLTAPVVQSFAQSQPAFFSAFSSAFVKLSSFQVLTGSQGEVRTNCHFTNS